MNLRFLFAAMFFCSFVNAQNDTLLKQPKPVLYNKYTAFAFYDIVRLAGAGFEFRPDETFSIDAKFAAVYANGIGAKITNKISDINNYGFNKGYGILLSPKYYVGKKRNFYLGLSAAFYKYGYKNKILSSGEVENYYGNTPIQQTETTKQTQQTKSFSFDYTLGFSKSIHHFNYEFFIAAGAEKQYSSTTLVYTVTPPFASSSRSSKDKQVIFNCLIGIKLGFGFKQQTNN